MLIHHIGHKDAFHAPSFEFSDVGVYEFCGEADAVAHHAAQGSLVSGKSGLAAEHGVEAGLAEQRAPKGILLIHVQHAWETDAPATLLGLVGWLPEDPLIFIGVGIVAPLVVVAFVAEDALALIS